MIIGGVVASSKITYFGGWLRWGRVSGGFNVVDGFDSFGVFIILSFDSFGVFLILSFVVVIIVAIATSLNLTQSQLVIVVTHSFCY